MRQPKLFCSTGRYGTCTSHCAGTLAENRSSASHIGRHHDYVTHDQTELTTLADKIVFMNGEHVQQASALRVICSAPVNIFVTG